jgi:hypothetical protein
MTVSTMEKKVEEPLKPVDVDPGKKTMDNLTYYAHMILGVIEKTVTSTTKDIVKQQHVNTVETLHSFMFQQIDSALDGKNPFELLKFLNTIAKEQKQYLGFEPLSTQAMLDMFDALSKFHQLVIDIQNGNKLRAEEEKSKSDTTEMTPCVPLFIGRFLKKRKNSAKYPMDHRHVVIVPSHEFAYFKCIIQDGLGKLVRRFPNSETNSRTFITIFDFRSGEELIYNNTVLGGGISSLENTVVCDFSFSEDYEE